MTELKPCPFCGSDRVHGTKARNGIYRVECWCCGASVESVCGLEIAIKWWNTRAIDRDALLDLADDLEEPWKLEDGFDTAEELRCGIEEYERAVAELIRKAVGA